MLSLKGNYAEVVGGDFSKKQIKMVESHSLKLHRNDSNYRLNKLRVIFLDLPAAFSIVSLFQNQTNKNLITAVC